MDILIKNGTIIDNISEIAYKSDLYISDGIIKQIASIIQLEIDNNVKIIDATGLIVTTGFIDMHSHSDATLMIDQVYEEKLQQGITTEVNGNCGFGLFPMTKDRTLVREIVKDLTSVEFYIKESDIKWGNFKDFKNYISKENKDVYGTNQAPLVPHGVLRAFVVGVGDKKVDAEVIEQMQKVLEVELLEGTWGMSTGLAYAPGCFSENKELLALCEILYKHNKVLVSHMRDEADNIIESVKEIIGLSKVTGCKVHISHLKSIGIKNWHKNSEIIKIINKANKDGARVTADIYPYEASSTMLSIVLPKAARKETIENLLIKLCDESYKNKIKDEVMYNLENRGGSDKIVINYASYKYDVNILGKSISEIGDIFNLDEFETIIKLIVDNKNIINAIYYVISEEGIINFLKQDFTVIGSDGMINIENKNSCHPRTFGTFPRVIAKYVKEKNVISLEKAIRKMSRNTAEILGIEKRGIIKVGNYADLIIFDYEEIKDNSTFKEAFKYPSGIKYVIVNGNVTLDNSKYMNTLSGRLLLKD